MVPIEEWIESEYYLGREARTIYPYWKSRIIEFFNSGKYQFIFHGSYSLGKTHIAIIVLLRVLYEMSCIVDFPSLFDLSAASKIMFAFVSVSSSKAKRSGIGKLLRIFDSIPYFSEWAPRNEDTQSALDLGFCEVVHASRVDHLIAEDFYGVIFDEANFVNAAAGDEYSKAQTLYLEAKIRGKTRFSIGGVQYGLFGLLSSAQYASSFTEQEIKRAKEDGDTYIIEAATYDVKPGAYSTERFDVFLGYGETPPFIVSMIDEATRASIAKTYGLTFDMFLAEHSDLIIQVPLDLMKFYKTDIEYALKTLSGKTVAGGSKLLKNPAILERAYWDQTLQSPLTVDIPTLSLMSDDVIQDFIREDVLLANYEDGCKVYIHLDLSLSGDKTGFGAVYKSEVTGHFRELLNISIHKRKESDEIDLSKVEDIIFYLRELGMTIGFVSYDQYASHYMSQEFKKRIGKDKTDKVSLDTDDTAYLLFIYLLKKNVVDLYRYAPFDTNFKALNHDTASCKVDHDKEHEKDVCDGLTGALSLCFRMEGLSREDIAVASLQEKDGFYADLQQDTFYKNLLEGTEGSGFYADVLQMIQ